MDSTKEFPAFFCYTEDLFSLFEKISSQLVMLHQLINNVPQIAIKHFRQSCLIEEIQASNEIEGVHSTKREIKTAIDYQADLTNANNTRLWGIVNKYEKLQSLDDIPFNNSQDLRTFYDSFVLDEVCRADPNNAPDGRIFRKSSVDIWGRTKVIHRGVNPEEKIILLMDKALAILQDKTIPSLIRISIFHYLFGYIHPFYDGNGRTSRFITSYYIAQTLDPLAALRLSITIKRSSRAYYKLFDETNAYGNCGDLTPFVNGFTVLIYKSIENVVKSLGNKMKQLFELSDRLDHTLSLDEIDYLIYFILLQAALFSDDGATQEEIAAAIGKSPRTVSNHIKKYPKDHIIINKENKAYRFKLNIKKLLPPG